MSLTKTDFCLTTISSEWYIYQQKHVTKHILQIKFKCTVNRIDGLGYDNRVVTNGKSSGHVTDTKYVYTAKLTNSEPLDFRLLSELLVRGMIKEVCSL